MPFDIESFDGVLKGAALHIIRVMGMIWFLPGFGSAFLGRIQKLGIAITVGLVAFVSRDPLPTFTPSEPIVVGIAVAREVLLGLAMGWLAGLIFDAARIGGSLIATEMGLNMANQVDPSTGVSQPLLSQLLSSLAVVSFFASGGHAMILGTVVSSFDTVQIGTFQPHDGTLDTLMGFTVSIIAAGIRIAAPAFLILIVVTICVGFLAKVAPQLHILEASWPIRITTAFFILILFLPEMLQGFDHLIGELDVNLHKLASNR